MANYFNELNKKRYPQKINDLEIFASVNKVPIIMKDSLNVILALIDVLKPKRILEIGTAIAYSAICMAHYSGAVVDTIERNDDMYELALKNIHSFGLDKQINVFHEDALNIDCCLLSTYDLIFIDAAKAQNIKFFEKFSPLLNKEGIIITDNLLFHGKVENGENISKNVKKMVEKIALYHEFLQNLSDYSTIFIEVGDGISVTRRKQ